MNENNLPIHRNRDIISTVTYMQKKKRDKIPFISNADTFRSKKMLLLKLQYQYER